jgi:phosphatidylserine/phosphatidylglycerophosphate/cardiolipin synthase-like enzyme
MNGHRPLETAIVELLEKFGTARAKMLADRWDNGEDITPGPGRIPVPGLTEAARDLAALFDQNGIDRATAVAYLRGACLGHETAHGRVRVETVWSGPGTHAVPVRDTGAVLLDLVNSAETELLLMTYSAREYPALLEALRHARNRHVRVDAVVETLAGAGSALGGQEPAWAFTGVPGLSLWHWPLSRREETGARMHAKVAVADRKTLLVTSANLTPAGSTHNVEAGLLVRGGNAPRRVVEHVNELRVSGILERLRGGAR